ncbi:MAG: helix-hairpin-helix domain-containing protein [Candidatus Hydrogenedentes bacterium]|nr:helix-hairpin-helix domain-containing protein [Candidatus Hydrogenedentota bacterium]
MIDQTCIQRIAQELSIGAGQVVKAIQLLDEGATLPFIARYRKDVTGNLDETKLEVISERNAYFKGLLDRRRAVLDAIAQQNLLTDELREKIESCYDKAGLEDLYLPYKKRRRTKATVAREKGLTPLADFLWNQEPGDRSVDEFAASFARPEKAVASAEEAIEGAGYILAERISLDLETRVFLRETMHEAGKILSHPTKNAEGRKTKYEAYYEFSEPVKSIPSHRFLAIIRGVKEGVLRMELGLDDERVVSDTADRYVKEPGSPFEPYLRKIVEDSYYRLLRPSVENEVISTVRERADDEAIRVFRENARNLLLSAPAGQICVIGVDPGMRTGCKLAVTDRTGTFLEAATVYPNPPQEDIENAEKVLLALMEKHDVTAVAIGNGTGSREAARFVRNALAKVTRDKVFSVFVSEAGASVYSTSKVAREEFPDLDATVRGAISIARRLQDPLSELVKVDPRHIGVGQYQHDVNQKRLREGLHRTVVSCVNRVGVDLNTASTALLRYVSGIQADVAQSIVGARAKLEGFRTRQQLLDVEGVGPKVYQQCAGFLRIVNGENVLDSTGIHPEAYGVVEQIAEALGVTPAALLNNAEILKDLALTQFQTELIGELTLADIRDELLKPGRDPRTEFKVPQFLDGVESVKDVEEGMETEGVVTNVTDFGAFVDIGVHQDGLVHLSELAHRFVEDPRRVVKVGEIVKVKVIKVDHELPRISLSMKALLPPPEPKPRRPRPHKRPAGQAHAPAERGAPAEPAAAASPGGDSGGRPARRDDARPQRPRRDKPRGQDTGRSQRPRKGSGRGHGGDRPSPRHGGDSGSLLNTQLADQLAALKDKLGS